eukprot:c17859_g1_i1.p1 GENE.c17859_g1_i1~~c17859_g1_i1.p1  ORF type:complete len:518 (-),score=88.03 c17859_g1_i1:103-1656(-)
MWEEHEEEVTPGRATMAKVAICSTALVDNADAVLLPSVFRAFEVQFNVGPSVLGILSLCQAIVQSLSSPFWGYCADSFSRRFLLTLGCFIVGVATICVGASQAVWQVGLFRAFTGIGLAAVGPIAQSLISDLVEPSRRGRAFGYLGVMAALGSMFGSIFATSVSQLTILGTKGWRFAFYLLAAVTLLLGVFVWNITFDPKRGGKDGAETSDEEGEAAKGGEHTETENDPTEVGEEDVKAEESEALLLGDKQPKSGEEPAQDRVRNRKSFAEWSTDILRFFQLRTFRFMALAGIFGCIPWSAMNFTTLFLQYIGFSDVEASTIFSGFQIGAVLGHMLGGYLGDAMAVWSPNYGRVLTAQLSEVLRIPCVVTLFVLLPRDPSHGLAFSIVLFLQGLVSTWCPAACNRPILSEIVSPRSRSSVFAMLVALEGSIGAFGAPMVGFFAENVFGYIKSKDALSTMDPVQREGNVTALAKSAVLVMSIPWALCIFLFGLIHLSYPTERKTARRVWSERYADKAS